MNQKINKITEEIIKVETQIAKLQERLPALKKKRAGMENAEIIRVVRTANVSPDKLAAFIASISGGNSNSSANGEGEDKIIGDGERNEGEGIDNES